MTKKKKPYIDPNVTEQTDEVVNEGSVSEELAEGTSIDDIEVTGQYVDVAQEEGNAPVIEPVEETAVDPEFEGSDEEGSAEPFSQDQTQEETSEEQAAEETQAEETASEETVETEGEQAPEEPVAVEEQEAVQSPAEGSNEAPAATEELKSDVKEQLEEKVEENVQKPVERVATKVEVAKTIRANVQSTSEAEVSPSGDLLAKCRKKFGSHRVINWDRKDCESYLETGVIPAETVRGNFVSDVTRSSRIEHWTPSEMKDFAEGLIFASDKEEEDLIWESIYRRYRLPGNASRQDVSNYLVNNVTVPTTRDGVLINDPTRDALPIDQWLYREVRAALLGLIESPYSRDELVARLRQLLRISDRYPLEKLLKSLETEKFGDMSVLILETKLKEYKEARSKSPAMIGDSNAMLLREIRKLLKKEYGEFKEGWVALLHFVKAEENSIFCDAKRYIHWDQVPLKSKDLQALTDLLTLLYLSVRPENRSNGLEVTTVKSLIEHLCNEEEQAKILTFYQR